MKTAITRQLAKILYAISTASQKAADRLVWLSRPEKHRH